MAFLLGGAFLLASSQAFALYLLSSAGWNKPISTTSQLSSHKSLMAFWLGGLSLA